MSRRRRATGGIPHPTGYPLYLLLARLFQFLPFGTLAFRTNQLSAIAAALPAGVVYEIVRRSPPTSSFQAWAAGLAAGYAFGLAPLIWSQAVITEVYALQAFLVILILHLYIKPVLPSACSRKSADGWRSLALGLAMGNHITMLLLVPIALLAGSIHKQSVLDSLPSPERRWFQDLRFDAVSLRRQLAWFGTGLTLYLILPLRALANPPVNWGSPITPDRFWWLISGQLYQNYYLHVTPAGLWERLQASAMLLVDQFGVPGLVLGFVGLVLYGSHSRLYVLTLWLAAGSLGFSLLYRVDDSSMYLIPMFLSFAIWNGLGIQGLAEPFSRRLPLLGLCFGLLWVGYFVGQSVTQMNEVDASTDHRAESFGRDVLSTAPENAMIFAQGDRAIFTLWYFHHALGERPDVAVMATDLLHFDW